jgi:hypothetical protein
MYSKMPWNNSNSSLPRLQQGQLNFSTRSATTETRRTSTQPSTPHSTPSTPSAITVGDDLDNEETRPSTATSTSESTVTARKKRTAWVFKHMDGTDDMQKIFFNAEGREVWPCKYTKHKRKEYIISGGTRNIEEHLWNKHKITEDAPVEKRLRDQQSSIEESMASAASHPQKRRRLAPETEDEKMLDPGVLESLYIKWITADNQAL